MEFVYNSDKDLYNIYKVSKAAVRVKIVLTRVTQLETSNGGVSKRNQLLARVNMTFLLGTSFLLNNYFVITRFSLNKIFFKFDSHNIKSDK